MSKENQRIQLQEKSNSMEQDLCIACQGTQGAYSGIAAKTIFPEAGLLFFENFESVLIAVRNGLCDYGVLPIKNNYAGDVDEVNRLMKEYQPSVLEHIMLPVTHSLLALPGTEIEDVTTVYSHPQAIRQCNQWLANHPQIHVVECANTAVASRMVSQKNSQRAAAISSDDCASLYHLVTLARCIQDVNDNTTEFVCIQRGTI